MPWAGLEALVAPDASEGKIDRLHFAVQTMLLIHFMRQWITLSDPAIEEAVLDVPLLREFAQLSCGQQLPDVRLLLRF